MQQKALSKRYKLVKCYQYRISLRFNTYTLHFLVLHLNLCYRYLVVLHIAVLSFVKKSFFYHALLVIVLLLSFGLSIQPIRLRTKQDSDVMNICSIEFTPSPYIHMSISFMNICSIEFILFNTLPLHVILHFVYFLFANMSCMSIFLKVCRFFERLRAIRVAFYFKLWLETFRLHLDGVI